MIEQTPPRDPSRAWPVIDGPWQGETIAAGAADFFYAAAQRPAPSVEALEALEDQQEPQATEANRVLYRLRAQGDGYVWSCAAEA